MRCPCAPRAAAARGSEGVLFEVWRRVATERPGRGGAREPAGPLRRPQSLPLNAPPQGTELSVTIEGNFAGAYKGYILRYLRQIAVITPYAQVGPRV